MVQLKAGRKIQLANKKVIIISEVGDKTNLRSLFHCSLRVAINLEVKFKALDADYKDLTAPAHDVLQKHVFVPVSYDMV